MGWVAVAGDLVMPPVVLVELAGALGESEELPGMLGVRRRGRRPA
ncbi:hypothetical protein AB0F17_35090 [Nonomuraea sp. NPDC026600]